MKLAVLGGGKMGEAFVRGLLSSGWASAGEIRIAEISESRRTQLARDLEVECVATPAEAVAQVPSVLVSVKPVDLEGCLLDAQSALAPGALVLSIAAGVRIETLRKFLTGSGHIVRAMPNLGATLGAGVTAFVAEDATPEYQIDTARAILESVGPAIQVEEELLDAVTAVSGSGPAYVFFLAEALEKAGTQLGLDPDTASLLTSQTILGAGRLLAERGPGQPGGMSAREWREAVTSKGGTTEAALAVLRDGEFEDLVARAVVAAEKRGRELGSNPAG